MDLAEIKELIQVMRRNKIKEIDLDQKGVKVKITAGDFDSGEKAAIPQMHHHPPTYVLPASNSPFAHHASPEIPVGRPESEAPAGKAASAKTDEPAVPAEEKMEGMPVVSPMVGTFYRAPAPDAPPYVEEGAVVNPESVVCIVEAMKLMNEIKAEVRGKVLKVLVENGQPVEYNQPLFLVEPF